MIIDTNIVIKHALNDAAAAALFDWIDVEKGCKILVNTKIISEYRHILKRSKLKLPPTKQRIILDLIEKNSVEGIEAEFSFNKDRDDIKFLALAKGTNADYLITDDKALKNAQWKLNTKILSLEEFLKLI